MTTLPTITFPGERGRTTYALVAVADGQTPTAEEGWFDCASHPGQIVKAKRNCAEFVRLAGLGNAPMDDCEYGERVALVRGAEETPCQ